MTEAQSFPEAQLEPEVFRKAAGLLIERGHTKHITEDHEGRVCLQGALSLAMYDQTCYFTEEVRAAVLTVGQIVGHGPDDNVFRAIDWNNRPERTLGEVVEALLETAKREDEKRASLTEEKDT